MAKSDRDRKPCRCTYKPVPVEDADERDSDDEAFAGLLPEEATAWTKCQNVCQVIEPFACISVSAVLNSLQGAVVKQLSISGFDAAVFEIVFWRGIFQSLGCVVAYVHRGLEISKWWGGNAEERRLLFWRGFIGYGGCGFGYHAISLLPLGEAQVLALSVPAFAAIFARAFLKEPLFVTDAIAMQASLVGMVLVARPPPFFASEPSRKFGVLFAFLSAACMGGAFVLVRALGVKVSVPWEGVVLAQATGQVLLSIPSMIVAGEPWLLPSPGQAVLLFTCGAMGFVSHAALTHGMQRTESAGGSLVRQTLAPICSFIWQAVFFHSDPFLMTSVLGALVILSGVAVTIVGKALREQGKAAGAEKARRVNSTEHVPAAVDLVGEEGPLSPVPGCKEGLHGL